MHFFFKLSIHFVLSHSLTHSLFIYALKFYHKSCCCCSWFLFQIMLLIFFSYIALHSLVDAGAKALSCWLNSFFFAYLSYSCLTQTFLFIAISITLVWNTKLPCCFLKVGIYWMWNYHHHSIASEGQKCLIFLSLFHPHIIDHIYWFSIIFHARLLLFFCKWWKKKKKRLLKLTPCK